MRVQIAYTRQVTIYKVPEKTRPCLSGQVVISYLVEGRRYRWDEIRREGGIYGGRQIWREGKKEGIR